MNFEEIEFINFDLNLGKNYCLKKINLKIQKNEKIAIIGPSGSGKTLLLESIILSKLPSNGTIKINDVDIWKEQDINRYRKLYSFTPQSVTIPPRQSVLNAIQSAYIKDWSTLKTLFSLFIPFKFSEVLNVLKEINLEKKIHDKLELLSGGEKQCVSLCRLFVSKPKIMVSDEPLNNLDPKSSIYMIKIILNYFEKNSSTLICSLHQPEIAIKYFDRVIGIKRGIIKFDEKSTNLSKKNLTIYINKHVQLL